MLLVYQHLIAARCTLSIQRIFLNSNYHPAILSYSHTYCKRISDVIRVYAFTRALVNSRANSKAQSVQPIQHDLLELPNIELQKFISQSAVATYSRAEQKHRLLRSCRRYQHSLWQLKMKRMCLNFLPPTSSYIKTVKRSKVISSTKCSTLSAPYLSLIHI